MFLAGLILFEKLIMILQFYYKKIKYFEILHVFQNLNAQSNQKQAPYDKKHIHMTWTA